MKLWRNKVNNRTDKQKIGQKGEDFACQFLKENGYKIVNRNYRQKWGEIDIISKKEKRLYFFEVKTVTVKNNLVNRETDTYLPEDNVHHKKIDRLFRTIETYLSENKVGEEVEWQLDILAVYLDDEGYLLKIDHLEDVF